MKLHLLAATASVFLLAMLEPHPATAQGTVASDHPLVGKWQWTRKRSQCTEVYEFRPDGTAPILSGAERTDNIYTVSAAPNEAGLYRVTLRTTKHHGGRDCSDAGGDPNFSEITLYVYFETSERMAICYEPSAKRCYGPLRRVIGQ